MGIDPLLTLLLMPLSRRLSPGTLEEMSHGSGSCLQSLWSSSMALVVLWSSVAPSSVLAVALVVAETALKTKISLCCPHSF